MPATASNRTSAANQPSKETLNFKVSSEFKKQYKGYAVSQGLTMLQLLNEGFELSKQKRQQGASR